MFFTDSTASYSEWKYCRQSDGAGSSKKSVKKMAGDCGQTESEEGWNHNLLTTTTNTLKTKSKDKTETIDYWSKLIMSFICPCYHWVNVT